MDRVSELEKLIKHHRALYYQGRPEINDHDYDSLENELKSLDPENKVLEMVGSISGSSKKIKHSKKMLSLNKTYKIEDLESWIEEKEVVSTFKIDGIGCSLIYKKGQFFLGKTRGDGSFGEDITEKVIWIDPIPSRVDLIDQTIEIRGELYCDEENFFYLSEEMEKLGLEKPSNPRNIVAGLMGRKDNLELCRYLRFKAFELILEKEVFKTEFEKTHKLQNFGFDIPLFILHKGMTGVEARLKEAREFISEGSYQIDGIVFTYNELKAQDELGATAHHPRYKMAFKFQGESKTTKIKTIEWSVSRNGFLTPVGIVQPVDLSGAKISRVTLHNFGMIKQYNLKKGDAIEIVRSGEVIPKFLSVIKSSSNKFHYPNKCPVCKSKTKIKDIRLLCSNKKCPGKIRESILNFIQKIGIDDISMKRLDEMIKANLIKDIPDLYRLTPEKLMALDKVKDKLANKLVNSIENSKSADLSTFLSALGIQGGAYNKCERIVLGGFDTIEKIKKLTIDQLIEVDSFAEKSATEFISSLKERIPSIDKLLGMGFYFRAKEIAETPVKGKKICITGSLSRKRSEMEKLLREAGAIMVTSVSKNTNYLLTNETEANSSKFKKAQSLGVSIISEEDVVKLIQG